MTQSRHSYSPANSVALVGPAMYCMILGLALVSRGLAAALSEMSDIEGWAAGMSTGLRTLLLGGIPLALGATLLTLYTEVLVRESGMRVRVWGFRWLDLPWADVLGVTGSPILGTGDLSTWCFVRVKRLTVFHRLASVCFSTGTDPVLIINKRISGYTELVRMISDHSSVTA